MIGFPLRALNTRLKVLPEAVPRTQEKTTKEASFGRYSKKLMRTTKAIDPPPSPANVAKLLVNPRINDPISIPKVGGHR